MPPRGLGGAAHEVDQRLALGRAVAPADRPVAHEPLVIALVSELAAKV